MVIKETGVSEEKAKERVDTVVGFLNTKLPAPMAEQVQKLLSGDASGAGVADMAKNVAKGLGLKI